jgi:hypothetical protein
MALAMRQLQESRGFNHRVTARQLSHEKFRDLPPPKLCLVAQAEPSLSKMPKRLLCEPRSHFDFETLALTHVNFSVAKFVFISCVPVI